MKLDPPVFFDTFSGIAVDDFSYSGVPPSIKLAQAALESGWAGSGLSSAANNYFGIKAHGWDGDIYNATTHEYYSSTPTITKADFRSYPSPYASFMDHSQFLQENPRYSGLFQLDPLDYKGWAHGLKSANYATSPDYAYKLINLIEKYDLQQYDLKAKSRKLYKTLASLFLLVMFIIVVILLIRKFR